MKAIYALLDTLPKCPWCGHTGPVSSHGDHWDGCPLTLAWIDGDINPPWVTTEAKRGKDNDRLGPK